MIRLTIFSIILGFAGNWATTSAASVSASRRHVVILSPGVDQLWGQYLFTIQNASDSPTQAELPVMMPREKKDWFPQEGVLPKDVKLGEGGAADVIISQEFKAGDTFVGFSFNVPSSFGTAQLTFEMPYDMAELMIMVSADALVMDSPDMTFQAGQSFAGRRYDTLVAHDLSQGDMLSVNIQGLPEGRDRYWLIGGIVGVLLLLIGGYGGWILRPHVGGDEDMVVEGTVA